MRLSSLLFLVAVTARLLLAQEQGGEVADLKREIQQLRETNEKQAAEIKRLNGLYAAVLEKLMSLTSAIPKDEDAKDALESRVAEQSKKRIRMISFKRTDGAHIPLGGYG